MLKAQLESLEGVDEGLHQFYEERDGGYSLKVEGLEDTGALKRAKDHEKQARKTAEDKARELSDSVEALQAKISDIENEGHRKTGDVEALEKSWQEKLANREAELSAQLEQANGSLKTILVDNKAIQLASELAVEGSSNVLMPHIKSRLAVDTRDGELVTVVLDEAGKPSALSIDELKQEIANTPAFAPVVIGSKASGSGATGESGGGASTTIDWTKASAKEKVAALKAKKSA